MAQNIKLIVYPVKDIEKAKAFFARFWTRNRMSKAPTMLVTELVIRKWDQTLTL